MSDLPNILPSRITQSRKKFTSETDILLNLVPYAVVVFDGSSERVTNANEQFIRLSGYSISQLVKITLPKLIPTWEPILLFSGFYRPDSLGAPTLELLTQNRKVINVKAGIQPLEMDSERYLLLLDPDTEGPNLNQRSNERFVEWIDSVSHLENIDLFSTLFHLLDAGLRLLGSSDLAIYTANDVNPELKQFICLGEKGDLPDTLPSTELSTRNSIGLWTQNRQTTTRLQTISRNLGASYLFTALLGERNARIGLLVILGTDNDPPQYLTKVGESLAKISTLLLEHFLQLQENERRIKQLIKADNRSQVLLDASLQGVLILSPELRIIAINSMAEKIFGYTKYEVINQPVYNILIGSESLLDQISSLVNLAKGYYSEDLQLFRRTGEIFFGKLSALPVIIDGEIDSVVIQIQDLTDLELIREQTRQLEQRAILGELTSVFAHEIRNPINNLSTGLELLSIQLDPHDPNLDTVNRLMQDCDRLTELMRSILTYSKPIEYTTFPIPLTPLLQSIIDRTRSRMEQLNIRYNLIIQPGCPPVRGNKRPLEQVFTNLINNAIQAMTDSGGLLTIRVDFIDQAKQIGGKDSRSIVQVSIIDTGPGIPEGDQEKIFQPFFSTRQGGTGLGLAITKNIIYSMHGTIKLDSIPGGTIFMVTLQAA